MVGPQQFGVGVGVSGGVGGVGLSSMGMPSSQQVISQQQQQQMVQQSVQQIQQIQQQQQIQLQQQQQQQQQASHVQQQSTQGSGVPTNPQTSVSSTTVPPQQQQQQQQKQEFNTVSLCKFGQETVQDIVSRALEIFQTLKLQPLPNGNSMISYYDPYLLLLALEINFVEAAML